MLHISLDYPRIYRANNTAIVMVKSLQPLFFEMFEYLLRQQKTYAPLALLRWYAVVQNAMAYNSIAENEFGAYLEVFRSIALPLRSIGIMLLKYVCLSSERVFLLIR